MENDSATSGAPTAPPKPLPHRSKWPKLDPQVQEFLVAFLTAYRAEAERGRATARELASIGPENKNATGMVAYWDHMVSACDWLIGRVPMRQRWLAELAQQEE